MLEIRLIKKETRLTRKKSFLISSGNVSEIILQDAQVNI